MTGATALSSQGNKNKGAIHGRLENAILVENANEIAFALNLGLFITAVFYSIPTRLPERVLDLFSFLILSVDGLLSTSQSANWYIGFFVPVVILAACIWLFVRFIRHTQAGGALLSSFAGIAALAVAPTWWLLASALGGHWWWWTIFSKIQFYEVVAALLCIFLYLAGRWSPSLRVSAILVSMHWCFWLWQFRSLFRDLFADRGGAIALTPIVGLIASFVWMGYRERRCRP